MCLMRVSMARSTARSTAWSMNTFKVSNPTTAVGAGALEGTGVAPEGTGVAPEGTGAGAGASAGAGAGSSPSSSNLSEYAEP